MSRSSMYYMYYCFPTAMDECPVCMESFDLDEHMPKSLDCRHAVCTECMLHPRGRPLRVCPICCRDIIDSSALPNDLSIIAYLEKIKREKYLKEQKKKSERHDRQSTGSL